MTSLKTASATTLLRLVAVSVLNALSVLLVANVLGPEKNAQYTLSLTFAQAITQLLNIGLGSSLVYFVKSNKLPIKHALRLAVLSWFILSGVALCITTSIESLGLYQIFPGVPPEILILGSLCTPFLLLQNIVVYLFLASERFTLFNLLLLCAPAVNFLSLALLSSFNLLVLSNAIYATLFSFFFAAVLIFCSLAATISFSWGRISQDLLSMLPLLRFGLPVFAANISSFLNYKADLAIVNFTIGTQAAGVYAMSVFLSESLGYVSAAVATSVMPRLVSDLSLGQRNTSRNNLLFRQTLYISFLLGVVLWSAYALISHLFLQDTYVKSLLPAAVLMCGTVVVAPFRILTAEITAAGKPYFNALAAVGALLVNCILSLWLSSWIGLIGAAIGSIIGYWCLCVIVFCCHRRVFGTSAQLLYLHPKNDLIFLFKIFQKYANR